MQDSSFCPHLSGYRDAQCGWSLVFENDDTVGDGKAVKSSRRRGSDSTRTGKGSSSHDGEGLAERKKAQCLCIYAPRRGILEVSVQQEYIK